MYEVGLNCFILNRVRWSPKWCSKVSNAYSCYRIFLAAYAVHSYKRLKSYRYFNKNANFTFAKQNTSLSHNSWESDGIYMAKRNREKTSTHHTGPMISTLSVHNYCPIFIKSGANFIKIPQCLNSMKYENVHRRNFATFSFQTGKTVLLQPISNIPH